KSTAEQRANAKWKQMLEEYEEPTMGADIERDMRRYIESHS
ncbi:MAG: trimethylamine methyltransferase family protein, partial [Butyricicoccus sp.]|nr:trimethylamine methyltransferase family protein [Butyricicoccus sp.]